MSGLYSENRTKWETWLEEILCYRDLYSAREHPIQWKITVCRWFKILDNPKFFYVFFKTSMWWFWPGFTLYTVFLLMLKVTCIPWAYHRNMLKEGEKQSITKGKKAGNDILTFIMCRGNRVNMDFEWYRYLFCLFYQWVDLY